MVREAAWVARCVGRAETVPLDEDDLTALAAYLERIEYARDQLLFRSGEAPRGVWMVRSGSVELSLGSGRSRVVIFLLHSGDVEGDIPLVLDRAPPYDARALEDVSCLFIAPSDFRRLLVDNPRLALRWISSCAMRLAGSQARIMQLLGRSLPEQVGRLLLDEAIEGRIPYPQRTLAAMLGVQRQSLNKVLKTMERRGLVQVARAEITITDAAGLQAVASP